MVDSVSAFMVYHAAVFQRLLPEHLNFLKGKCVPNRIDIPDVKGQYMSRFVSKFN